MTGSEGGLLFHSNLGDRALGFPASHVTVVRRLDLKHSPTPVGGIRRKANPTKTLANLRSKPLGHHFERNNSVFLLRLSGVSYLIV